jgi:hypothetical protein
VISPYEPRHRESGPAPPILQNIATAVNAVMQLNEC